MRYAVPDQIVTVFLDDDSVIGGRQVERQHGPLDASEPHSQMPSDGRDLGRWHSRTSRGRPICLHLSGRDAKNYGPPVPRRASTRSASGGAFMVLMLR